MSSGPMAAQLERIREYTRQHDELQRAHHFTFDLKLGAIIRYIVMGMNPGEPGEDHLKRGPTEETSEFDFQEKYGRSVSSGRWYSTVRKIMRTNDVLLADCFFWSAPSMNAFSAVFGYPFERAPHLGFCRDINREAIDFYKPAAIVVPGVQHRDLVATLYSLRPERSLLEERTTDDRGLLIVPYTDGQRPWVFTKHWSGARLSNIDAARISTYIARLGGHDSRKG